VAGELESLFRRIQSKRMKRKYTGKNNSFYGKKHSKETKEKIRKRDNYICQNCKSKEKE